ncbi:interferon alpha-inducible protein 27-like protein 2A isoform X4 [Lethenteron reissneri]|uniref:interferon alpha-inducible protein 27-like protein 2A isoform X4 n=1 Tax=Lethenteron reissneri TaxID=7753 RepID=UPI002AB7E9EA|nr:interferon alpha-inducible protein 27-like protein 2A isoform X4 [Lethenteron reissneri]
MLTTSPGCSCRRSHWFPTSTESAMTSQRIAVLFIAAILSVSITPAIAKEGESTNWCKIGAMAAGGVGAVVLAPVLLGAAGFGAAGIAAGSVAAKAMSLAAAANGGGVAAGGIVAGLQAAGAAGLGPGAVATLGTAGAAIINMLWW